MWKWLKENDTVLTKGYALEKFSEVFTGEGNLLNAVRVETDLSYPLVQLSGTRTLSSKREVKKGAATSKRP